MTLGERLNTYLAAMDQPQKAIAAEWLGRYQKRNPKETWKLVPIATPMGPPIAKNKGPGEDIEKP